LLRSWHKSTRVSDLILGSFVEIYLPGFNAVDLDQFEALLDCSDAGLFDWIMGRTHAPPQHDHEVTWSLCAFCALPAPSLQPAQN
jgi:antitoxin CptB